MAVRECRVQCTGVLKRWPKRIKRENKKILTSQYPTVKTETKNTVEQSSRFLVRGCEFVRKCATLAWL